MPVFRDYSRRARLKFFLSNLSKNSQILEVGCKDGWLGKELRERGFENYTGLDLNAPADIVGSILEWREIGIKPESYDAIFGFELVEHVPCFKEFYDILKPGGKLFITSPVPHFDFLLKIMESLNLNQKRTSPHEHLIYFNEIPYFKVIELKRFHGLIQFGKFMKPDTK